MTLPMHWLKYKWYNVIVDFDSDQTAINEWIIKNAGESRYAPLMDDTPVGMSLVYGFLIPEDAIAFKLKFNGR